MANPTPEGGPRRPRAGSFLDKSAKRVIEILRGKHGLTGMDAESTYLSLVAEIKKSRDEVAEQFSISVATAQRYIDDDTFNRIADKVAEYLGAELPGTDPFADETKVEVTVAHWLRATLSLQLAGAASRKHSSDYSWSLMMLAMSMTMAQMHGGNGERGSIRVPRAGTVYLARTLEEAAARILANRSGYQGISAAQLAEGLTIDSMNLRLAL
jgi:hypothetical protein